MSRIKLVLSDVDGTLVTPDKQLAPSTVAAVARLRENGIEFAVTSGRPPLGMAMLIEPLAITTPLAAFNGGAVVKPDMSVVVTHEIDPDVVSPILDVFSRHNLSPWVFRGEEWVVLDRHGPHVDREVHAIQFEPEVRSTFNGLTAQIPKLVGVNDDRAVVVAATEDVVREFGSLVSASSSQPYYLDVTHRDANKGWVVSYLVENFHLDPSEIATIGDGDNDVLMFQRSGLSIAMSSGSPAAQAAADRVTAGNDADGFALAIDEIVLQS